MRVWCIEVRETREKRGLCTASLKRLPITTDIKGGNILVTVTGKCKLADFGASKILDLATDLGTAAGQLQTVRGTPWFMAPEVIREDGHAKFVIHSTISMFFKMCVMFIIFFLCCSPQTCRYLEFGVHSH